ncbi:MAG: glycosyl hydrolase 115 family protein [Bacteroidaceae bacterium]|nr:glycosyl hydrolase 115 family protein [Bacteroidaceae bacterium]
MKKLFTALMLALATMTVHAIDHKGIATNKLVQGNFTLIENGKPTPIFYSQDDDKGVIRAIENLRTDFSLVCGNKPETLTSADKKATAILVGTMDSPAIKDLVKKKLINVNELKGKREKYIMTTLAHPTPNIDEALVIVGSDKRGTIYGVYELSEQIGVSPWYYWADAPVQRQQNVSIQKGSYTAGEPAVTYRGIFLNDEAPCLTTWVKNTFKTDFGGRAFYEHVFELLLRLRANFMWPAMWGWAFYADDPQNSDLANEMGIIMGTSHHEPMARNHQEYVRNRNQYGAWDYTTNKEGLDRFFREGMKRAKNTEDLITIGMRGDGDAAMGVKEGDANQTEYIKNSISLLENIINNQRRIIKEETGRPAKERPQVWALYKEVQTYYDMGLKVPDDVTILISDDNWGDVRHLPNAEERKRSGGWGMYYHVDYVGAPRNSKWLNVTPIQNLWEQMSLTYQYGVDKLWVLNVGDLKPMEYPITLFLNMAWNPTRYTAENLLDHPKEFCMQQFGDLYQDEDAMVNQQAKEAARILNLYSKYNGRVTAEMLDRNTYNLQSGEWTKVVMEYKSLEADALRLFNELPKEKHDAYQQLILFPVQAMCNIYEMYYAQAQNHQAYQQRRQEANYWAEECERCFHRDSVLCARYNKNIANGKWDGMMIQKHIGYTSWNDNFPREIMPNVYRLKDDEVCRDSYVFAPESLKNKEGYLSIDAEHYYSAQAQDDAQWTVIPNMGRSLSAISLQPYNVRPNGASLTYAFKLPEGVNEVNVHVVTKSTLAFERSEGHRYTVGFKGADKKEINYNGDMNEEPQNIHRTYYPVVARRVVEKTVVLPVKKDEDGNCYLEITPLDPAVVFEELIIDYGGYKSQYLFGTEAGAEAIKNPLQLPRPQRQFRPRQ